MSDVLAPLLPDPPGVWVRPDEWPPTGYETFDPTRETHRPVTIVTLTTPNGHDPEEEGDPVTWETWHVTPVSGDVRWDARAFPRGTATIEIPPFDAAAWTAGSGTAQPASPTLSSDGIPWACSPWGTIVAVYHGWDVDGDRVGVRTFDGYIASTDMARPGNTWVLQARDFTGLLDDTQGHQDRHLDDLTASVSQPEPETDDAFLLATAVKFLAREATENWWPLPLAQLAPDGDYPAGVFSFAWEDFDEEDALVPRYTNMGGRSLWSWVEEWCDLYGVEAAAVPGSRGGIRVAAPPSTTGDPRHTFTAGPGGNLLSWTATYSRIVNRALATLETRAPEIRVSEGRLAPGNRPATDRDWRVRMDGLSMVLHLRLQRDETPG